MFTFVLCFVHLALSMKKNRTGCYTTRNSSKLATFYVRLTRSVPLPWQLHHHLVELVQAEGGLVNGARGGQEKVLRKNNSFF